MNKLMRDCNGDWIDTNIAELGESIFGQDPKPANTIKLLLDTNESPDFDANDVLIVVKTLCLYGLQKLFGTNDFSQISASEFSLMREYTHSFGFDIDYQIVTTEAYTDYLVSFQFLGDQKTFRSNTQGLV